MLDCVGIFCVCVGLWLVLFVWGGCGWGDVGGGNWFVVG